MAQRVSRLRRRCGGDPVQPHAHHGDAAALIRGAIDELSVVEYAKNPSHIYARGFRKTIVQNNTLGDLHLRDVLIALRNAGYTVDRKTGLLHAPETETKIAQDVGLVESVW